MQDDKQRGRFIVSQPDQQLPPDRRCMHCGRAIPWGEGHVDDEVGLCDDCLHND